MRMHKYYTDTIFSVIFYNRWCFGHELASMNLTDTCSCSDCGNLKEVIVAKKQANNTVPYFGSKYILQVSTIVSNSRPFSGKCYEDFM